MWWQLCGFSIAMGHPKIELASYLNVTATKDWRQPAENYLVLKL